MDTHLSLADATPLDELARRFSRFAEIDGRDDPLYMALARSIAERPELLALMAHAPETQRLPVLLLAALHERILSGADHGLAAYYPSVGGRRAPDEALPLALLRFVAAERDALVATLRSRRTQTNEIGRCAVLWPALQALCGRLRAAGGPVPQDLALFDFGCSAGLNLGVDAYGYRDEARSWGAAGSQAPQIATTWRGPLPDALLGSPRFRIAARMGCDLAPIDPASPREALWLQACLWPGDAQRRERLRAALTQAAQRRDRRVVSDDGLTLLAAWLDELAAAAATRTAVPVLFNAWVLAYFDTAALARHRARVEQLVLERGLAWISAEAGARSPLDAPPPCPDGESPGSATLWTLQWRDAQGRRRSEALAWSHPHGRWIQWLADEDPGAPASMG